MFLLVSRGSIGAFVALMLPRLLGGLPRGQLPRVKVLPAHRAESYSRLTPADLATIGDVLTQLEASDESVVEKKKVKS